RVVVAPPLVAVVPPRRDRRRVVVVLAARAELVVVLVARLPGAGGGAVRRGPGLGRADALPAAAVHREADAELRRVDPGAEVLLDGLVHAELPVRRARVRRVVVQVALVAGERRVPRAVEV